MALDYNFFIFTAIVLLIVTGLYCLVVTQNLIRLLIGLEILTKAVTLLLVTSGFVTGWIAITQSMTITLIIIEVVIVVVASGIIIGVCNHNRDLDIKKLRKLKG
jgi:multisubunit Na+/H+ antiporter MnhC subunit